VQLRDTVAPVLHWVKLTPLPAVPTTQFHNASHPLYVPPLPRWSVPKSFRCVLDFRLPCVFAAHAHRSDPSYAHSLLVAAG
jgi:hypothetical protein